MEKKKKKDIYQCNRIGSPEMRPHVYGQMIFQELYSWERRITLIRGFRETGYPHAEE